MSVATVSYVLNNRADQKISDATRKKVLQIVNLLNYTPDRAAQALGTNRSRDVALLTATCPGRFFRAAAFKFADALAGTLLAEGYRLVLLPSDAKPEQLSNFAALVCCGVSSRTFYAWGDANFIPLIAADCVLRGEWLFFQVISDYSKARESAEERFRGEPYTFLCPPSGNEELNEHIRSTFDSVVFAADEAPEIDGNVFELDDAHARSEAVLRCIGYAINREERAEHLILV